MSGSPREQWGYGKMSWSPRSCVWLFVCLGQVSGLLFACFPSWIPCELILQKAHSSSPLSECFSAFGYMDPPCAIPLTINIPGKTPACLPLFLQTQFQRRGLLNEVLSSEKKPCKKQLRWGGCPKFCFLFFSFFSKIVKTHATHTCKRIKKGEKIAAGSCFPHCYLVAL